MEKQEWQKRGKGHRARLRDRFLTNGLEGFTDEEILELLLSFGTPRSDCKQAARELLKTFGSFSAVLDAPISALSLVNGVGTKNSFALHFVRATANHYLKSRVIGEQYLKSSEQVVNYLQHALRGLKKEVMAVIFLDSKNVILSLDIVAEGTINTNTIHPREVIKLALDYHAAAIVIAHNHPSGSVTPSQQDRKLTKILFLLCHQMHIRLLDHLIIGETVYSFHDSGVLGEVAAECRDITSSW